MKRRKSGNGISRSQDLYILWNFPYFWLCKIGISGNAGKRAKCVSDTAPGYVFPIFKVRLPFAWQLEQTMHRLFAPFNVRFSGQGKTEWFICIVAPFAALIMLFSLVVVYVFYVLAAFLLYWALAGFPSLKM